MKAKLCAFCGSAQDVVSVVAVISTMGSRADRAQVTVPALHVCGSCSARSRVYVGERLFLTVESAIKTAIEKCKHVSGASVEAGVSDSVGAGIPSPLSA